VEGSPFSPAIAADGDLFLLGGVAKKYVDTNLVNTQALERADPKNQITNAFPREPVRPAAPTGQTSGAEKPQRPRTSSSGGTPSKLEELGLS
jgi:hypothetical protein